MIVSYAPFNATEITRLNELKLLRTLCERPVDAVLSGCDIRCPRCNRACHFGNHGNSGWARQAMSQGLPRPRR